jgi:hypothetical protein
MSDAVSESSRHRQLAECPQQLSEDIIHGFQWAQIETILKVPRNKGKNKSDLEKWYELWAILFPNDPAPAHPC